MPASSSLLDLAERYIALCCRLETPPRVAELAQLAGVAPTTLVRRFRREYDRSLSAVLKRMQLRQAKRMLLRSTLSTTRIAYACGYGTRRTFFRTFVREVGMTPAQYRERAVRWRKQVAD